MHITYSSKVGRFVIDCDFTENKLIAALPERRFMKRTKKWHAPALSRNSRFLVDNLSKHMDQLALDKAHETLNRSQVRRVPFPAWYDFKTEPFPHQSEGLDHVWGLDRHALFMYMGTGKTKMAIDFMSAKMVSGKADAWVVFCPDGVVPVWVEDEVPTHCPIRVEVVPLRGLSKAQARRAVQKAQDAERFVLVVPYDSIKQKEKQGTAFDTLVQALNGRTYGVSVDESHKCKNPDANTSKNVEFVSEHARFAQIMTGTPTSKGYEDLYQQFRLLDPNIVGLNDFFAFKNRYCVKGGFENREIVGYQNLDELMGLINPYVFQCTEEEANVQLPETTWTRRVVQLTSKQRRVYKEIDSKKRTENEGAELVVDQVLQKYSALQQVVGGFFNYDEEQGEDEDTVRRTSWVLEPKDNPKVQEVLNVLQERPRSQVIVWCKFRNEIAQLKEVLGDQAVEYHGGVDPEERERQKQRFREGKARVFLSNELGQEGITLNEADVTVYFSNSFKYVQRVQTQKRNHRSGQTKNVLYIDLVAEGTVDEDVLESLQAKKDVARFVEENMSKTG